MRPHYQKLAFAYVVHQVSNALTRQLASNLKHKVDLSYSQFLVIAAINFLERANQSDVASFLNQSHAAVHRQVNAAVKRGYITRIDAYGYQRELLLQITPKGTRLVEDMSRTLEEELRAILPTNITLASCIATLQAVNRQLPRRAAFPFDLL